MVDEEIDISYVSRHQHNVAYLTLRVDHCEIPKKQFIIYRKSNRGRNMETEILCYSGRSTTKSTLVKLDASFAGIDGASTRALKQLFPKDAVQAFE